MEYVLYIDVFFLTNLFLNLQSLLLTAVFLRKQLRMLRIGLAAVIGSLWSCMLVCLPMGSAGVELLVSLAITGSFITGIAFGTGESPGRKSLDQSSRYESWTVFVRRIRTNGREILAADLALYAAMALLSGGLTLFKGKFFLTDVESLVISGLLTIAFAVFLHQIYRTEKIGNKRFLVHLYYQGESRKFTALADSGNRLRVPETGKPVALISYQDCTGFCDRVSGGFFIPYRAVGTDHGLLFAITFEKMEIEKNGICITIEHPAVAIVKESLSSNGDFNMILPEEYVSRF